MRLCVLSRHTEVEGVGVKHKTFFGDFEVLNLVVPAGIEDVIFVDGQPFSQMYIVGVGAEVGAVEGFYYNVSLFNSGQYSFVTENHSTFKKALSPVHAAVPGLWQYLMNDEIFFASFMLWAAVAASKAKQIYQTFFGGYCRQKMFQDSFAKIYFDSLVNIQEF